MCEFVYLIHSHSWPPPLCFLLYHLYFKLNASECLLQMGTILCFRDFLCSREQMQTHLFFYTLSLIACISVLIHFIIFLYTFTNTMSVANLHHFIYFSLSLKIGRFCNLSSIIFLYAIYRGFLYLILHE